MHFILNVLIFCYLWLVGVIFRNRSTRARPGSIWYDLPRCNPLSLMAWSAMPIPPCCIWHLIAIAMQLAWILPIFSVTTNLTIWSTFFKQIGKFPSLLLFQCIWTYWYKVSTAESKVSESQKSLRISHHNISMSSKTNEMPTRSCWL